jgi:hypothetical protein
VKIEESLTFAAGKNITLIGGHDCDYQIHGGFTTINGLLIGGTDQVTIEKVRIR